MATDIKSLREIIRATMTPTIEAHRKSRDNVSIYNDTIVTDDEINRLLFSIPYFDRSLCYHLMSDGIIANKSTGLWVTENWLREFRARIEYWTASVSWLDGELILIHFPGFMGRAMVDDDQLKLPRLLFNVKLS